MPWSVEDVDAIKSGLDPAGKARWVAIANNVLKGCLAKGGDEKTCAANAIKSANAMTGKK
jgi:hypothetical protein